MKSRYKTARRLLIFWTLFIGLGAVAGASGMLLDPTGKAMGMDSMLPYFQKLPFADVLFQDYVFPGIALLIVNGISNLTAAALLFARKKSGVFLGGLFGVTLMLWICIQFYMFPLNFMSTIYFIFGFLQAVTGYAAWVFLKQESFRVNESDYKNIGTKEGLWFIFHAWAMLKRPLLRRPTERALMFTRSGPQSLPTEQRASGGAEGSVCTGGKCRLKKLPPSFQGTTM